MSKRILVTGGAGFVGSHLCGLKITIAELALRIDVARSRELIDRQPRVDLAMKAFTRDMMDATALHE